MVRALSYDGTGFWLMTKRLSKGKFTSWPSSNNNIEPLIAKQLRQLLSNNDQGKSIINGIDIAFLKKTNQINCFYMLVQKNLQI
ncbi:hypothetical protein CJF42_03535 [Pseudoalteromonas sp. NBT06-2]|uniref:IS66 family insertion sequence element accessory protein TnpB n=1 Tax=Pseudoalteromonas sp. NBT06-2 TaxID=2025950 RepID=UPI000BA764CE|nr:hypothetical protein CJF42_03535 [Pseudoalteromonas sp. NBT06-2]